MTRELRHIAICATTRILAVTLLIVLACVAPAAAHAAVPVVILGALAVAWHDHHTYRARHHGRR